ncbi:MAG TPA: hypothetical protein VGX71_23850 [Pseudaminobacter sp.]|nr:hypothetical protein [Pseudaminobacter sp.]
MLDQALCFNQRMAGVDRASCGRFGRFLPVRMSATDFNRQHRRLLVLSSIVVPPVEMPIGRWRARSAVGLMPLQHRLP